MYLVLLLSSQFAQTYRVEVLEVVRKVQKWVTTATNAIDSEDGKLVEQVFSLKL